MGALSAAVGFFALVYATAAAAAAPAATPKAEPEKGKQIAGAVCAACHGADGNSVVPANPSLAGQHAAYTAAQLAAYKAGTRVNPIMSGMASALSPEDMRNVAAWFEQQAPKPTVGAKDKALAQRGQQLWRAGNAQSSVPACAGCHGAAGAGIPDQYPRLAGQHAELTLGWLKAYASGSRANVVMSGIAARLSESDMRALAEYIAGLR